MFLRVVPLVLPLLLVTRALNSSAIVSSIVLSRSLLVRVPKSQVRLEPAIVGVRGLRLLLTPAEKIGAEAVPSFRNDSPVGRASTSLKLAKFPSGTVTCSL